MNLYDEIMLDKWFQKILMIQELQFQLMNFLKLLTNGTTPLLKVTSKLSSEVNLSAL